jgi:acyl dehydratase
MDRFLEDLSVGDKFETAPIPVNEEEVLEFARRYDPQPMHADPEAAARGVFQGLIASGWHTAALVMKLNAEARMLGNTPMLGLGVDNLAWPMPVRPGDTLRVVTEVTKITPSRSKPEFGIVSLTSTAYNQHGQVVFIAKPNCWVPRRPTSSPDGSDR